MDNKMDEHFPWIPIIKRGFLKSFYGDYEIGTLDLLQQNIDEEVQKVQQKHDLKRAEDVFECIDYFYIHFCRKWNNRNKFSSHMEAACVHILYSFIKISLLLSRGNKESKWIYQVVTKIMRFPGEKNVMYDALLSVHCLNKKYKSAYSAILMHVLVYIPLFVPAMIDDPAEYLKVYLLVRRLKISIEDPVEKFELLMRASKILAPSTLSNWLLAHNFRVDWIKTARLKINLCVNICKKMARKESEIEVVETLRKILLPGICTERITGQLKPSCGLKRRKVLSTKKKNSAENMRTYNTNLFKKINQDPILSEDGEVEVTESETNEFVFDKKNRKRQRKKRGHLEENLQCKTRQTAFSLHECNTESVKLVPQKFKKQKLNMVKEKILKKHSQSFDKDSCFQKDSIEDMKQNADRRKRLEVENSKKEEQKDFMCSNDSVATPKRKKIKQKDVKIPEIRNETSVDNSLLKEHSETAKNERKKQNTKELDCTLKEIKFNAEDLSIIVDEITVSDDDEPLIVTEVKHYANFGMSSSFWGKNKYRKTDLKENTVAETKIVTEKEFVIDSKPSSCISESGAVQIMYDAIYDSEQMGAISREKPKNIVLEKDLNSSVDLQDVELFTETNSASKIGDKSSHTSEETLESGTDLQKDDHPSIETDELCSSTNNSSSRSNNSAPEAEIQKDDNASIETDKHFSLISNNSAREAEIQKDDNASIETNEHSSLRSDNSAQDVEIQKDDRSSVETDELVSGTNKVDVAETNRINTETKEDNSKIIIRSELPFKKSILSCLIQKEEVIQENRVPEPPINSPSNNISCLKTEGISSQILGEATSESVSTIPSERKNLEMLRNNCSIEIKSKAPLRNSIPGLLENKISVQSVDTPTKTNNCAQEIELKEGKLTSNNSLPNKIDPEVVSNSDSNIFLDVDNCEIKNDKTSDIKSPSLNDSIRDLPVKQVRGPFLDAKYPVINNEVGLPENSQELVNQQILDENQTTKRTQAGKSENNEFSTPNSSAAKGMMDNMLKIVELAGGESTMPNILKGDLALTLNTLSLGFLSKVTSSSGDGKSAKCLSFLDISTESVSSPLKNIERPESLKFLQYREFLSEQDDNRSEDTLSENKSIAKTDASEYHSDASHDIESEESNPPSECDFPVSSSEALPEASISRNNSNTNVVETEFSFGNTTERCELYKEENDESNIKSSQSTENDISAKHRLLKGLMLNPVVDLGKKCDSKSFIGLNSSVSTDLLNTITNSTVQPDDTVDEEIIERKPVESNSPTSTVSQSRNLVDEITTTQEKIEDFSSNSEELGEFSEVNNDFKMEIQHENMKKTSLKENQEMAVSDKGKKLSLIRKESETSIGMTLRERPAPEVKTWKSPSVDDVSSVAHQNTQKSASVDETSTVAHQNTQKSVSVDEGSTMAHQNTPTSGRMSLRMRNTSVSSNQEVRKSKSKTLASETKHSSKRLRKEVNLGFDFSELSLNSPKAVKNVPNDSSTQSSSEVLKDDNESLICDQVIPGRRLTRASVISSSADSRTKDQDVNPEGYNLRSRRSVIMPGKLKL